MSSTIFRTVAASARFARAFSSTAARSDVNKVILVGRVGANPIVTEVAENRRVANYTLATSDFRTDKEGNLIKRTQWHRISSWNPPEWFLSKVKKGDLVYVEGALRYSDYTDREGVMRTRAEINQEQFKVLQRSGSRNEEAEEE